MNRQKTKRLLGAASILVMVGVAPLVAATPASANQSTCVNYIGNKGYLVGPKVREACGWAAAPSPLGRIPSFQCTHGLEVIRVKSQHAFEACSRA